MGLELKVEQKQRVYQKQIEQARIGKGACKAFTPWYYSCDIKVGDKILVEIISENEVIFSKI